MGGIGIFLGLLMAVPFLSFSIEMITVLASVVILFVAGFYDDVYDMKSMVKLFIQLACAVGLYFSGFKIDNLHGIFGINQLPEFSAFMITIFFIAGVTNAFNLLDGIDGLAGGISVINSLFFGAIFLLNKQVSFAILAFALSAAILGFLRYNYHPAKIFMGDTGSLFLGLLMSVFVIKIFQTNTSGEESISIAIVLIFLPAFDTLRLFLQRILKNKSPFLADKNHLHHLVLKVVPSHAYATIIICLFHGALLSFIFLGQLIVNENRLLTLLVILLALLICTFLSLIIIVSFSQKIQKIKQSIT
jgi:UDP-N-acetylmuramyl pentapeptide phosphotransferase/UDP-N-acetylglucosamine-1-phosphate transferase